jgi:hypothetical protein
MFPRHRRTAVEEHPHSPTRVRLVTRGGPADLPPEQLRRIRETVTDANVRLVAPALAVPGGRWTIDLDARESQARRGCSGGAARWLTMPRPSRRRSGMPIPRPAVADARRELPAARVVDASAAERKRTAEPGLLRLAERYGLMPAPVAADW